jgi:hypothetical protein
VRSSLFRLRSISAYGRDELVSALRDGLDEHRRIGGVPENFAKPLDSGVESGVEVDKSVGRPQCGAQFLSSHDTAGLLQELQ